MSSKNQQCAGIILVFFCIRVSLGTNNTGTTIASIDLGKVATHSADLPNGVPNAEEPTPTNMDDTPTTQAPTTPTEPPTLNPPTKPPPNDDQDGEDCPSLVGNMDALTQDQFITRLTHTCRYDKLVRPDTEKPLNVLIQIDLQHIEAVDQLQFKTHMLVQYRYRDNRLIYSDISPNRGTMVGEEPLREKIWVPHIMLSNEKETEIMGLEGKDMFASISRDGEVIFSYRMTATIYCWMDLKKFPFDTQTCGIYLKSWTYNASNLVLSWENNEPVKVASQLHLTEFSLKSYRTYTTMLSTGLSKSAFVGNYSTVVFQFQLQREVGYYIMDYFVPSIMLVCTSWVTFWLQADASAPRITLGTSTMLTFITLSSGKEKNIPKVSYIKASEIWFLGITVFIFASMAEFAFVNIIWRRKKKVELKKKNSKYILKSTLTPSLARKELRRSNSMNQLQKSRSLSSLDSATNNQTSKDNHSFNNYLTVHSFPSINIPTITTQSADDLVTNGSQDSVTTVAVPEENQNVSSTWTTMTPQEVAIWIDKRSRIAFPCAFIVFNILYWSFVYVL